MIHCLSLFSYFCLLFLFFSVFCCFSLSFSVFFYLAVVMCLRRLSLSLPPVVCPSPVLSRSLTSLPLLGITFNSTLSECWKYCIDEGKAHSLQEILLVFWSLLSMLKVLYLLKYRAQTDWLSLSQQPWRFTVINAEERLRANQSEQRQPGDVVDLGGAATGCPGIYTNTHTHTLHVITFAYYMLLHVL